MEYAVELKTALSSVKSAGEESSRVKERPASRSIKVDVCIAFMPVRQEWEGA